MQGKAETIKQSINGFLSIIINEKIKREIKL